MKLCVVSMVINQRSCRKEGMLGLNFRFVVGGTHLDSHFLLVLQGSFVYKN